MLDARAMLPTAAPSPLLLQLLAGAAYALGGASMKVAQTRAESIWVVGVYLCFIAGATLQMRSLRFTAFGTGYVLVLGLEAALSVGAATLLFAERPNPTQWLGIVLVLAGAAMLRS